MRSDHLRILPIFILRRAAFRQLQLLLVAATAWLIIFAALPVQAETDQAGEYQVKSAYLYHFAKYIDWPSESVGNTSSFTICVLGKSPFGNALGTIAGKTIRGRHVTVTYLNRIEELKECNILYIAASEKANLSQIISAVASRPILTVSDIRRFTNSSGMIGFVIANDKVRFEINQRSAHRAGLRISAQLLKLATSVTE